MRLTHEIILELSKFFKADLDRFTPDTVANDIQGWDSLAHADLLMTLESRFNISFELADLMMINNVGDLCSIIENKKC